MPPTTTLFILASIFLFLIGGAGGWMLATKSISAKESHLQLIVGLLVTIVWVISIAAGIIIPSYSVSTLIHAIMGAVVGYLFSEDGLTPIKIRDKEK